MIPDGWSIDQFENGNIMFSHPQHGGLCIAPGNAVHALCTALLRGKQERRKKYSAIRCAVGVLEQEVNHQYSLREDLQDRTETDDAFAKLRAAIDAAMAKGGEG